MKHITLFALGLVTATTGANAGGMDRSGQSIAPIFEDGTYVELSYSSATPSVSGTFMGASSGSMAPSYSHMSGAFKHDLSDALSMALIIDQPFGAGVDYPTGTGYALAGTNAKVTTTGLTALLRYKLNDRFSVHGGIKHLTSHGEVGFPFADYTLSTTTESDWGYLVGAAYEIPDIALRASLTYSSATDINFTATETITGTGTDSPLDMTLPQSVNFDFQTGIAADTLLMFSARWADWTSTTITPVRYTADVDPGNNLLDHANDIVTYSLGIGRQLNDKLSGSLSVGYEKSYGGVSGHLSPTDGYTSVTAGLKYQISTHTALSGGASYVWIGDTTTNIGGGATDFSDNSAFGFGLKLSHTF